MTDSSQNYRIQSVDRAIDILNTFTFNKPELGVSDIVRELGLHRSTVHRFLMTLARRGYLEKNPETNTYRLGVKVFELGNIVFSQLDFYKTSKPYLEELVERTGESSHLVILSGDEVLYVDKVDNKEPLSLRSRIGLRYPATCTAVGKVLLAYLPEEKLDEIIGDGPLPTTTPKSITSPQRLKEVLKSVRTQGYAIDSEEANIGIRCIAAPISDFSSSVIAAISVSGPSLRMPPERDVELIPIVVEIAQRISAELGFPQT